MHNWALHFHGVEFHEENHLTKKGGVWVVVHGRALDVSNFLSQHLDDEVDILSFAGKDASAVFDLIHPCDFIGKCAPDAVIGTIWTVGGSGSAPAATVSAVAQVGAAAGLGGRSKEYAPANKNQTDRMDRFGKVGIPVIGPFSYVVLACMKKIILTNFWADEHRVDE